MTAQVRFMDGHREEETERDGVRLGRFGGLVRDLLKVRANARAVLEGWGDGQKGCDPGFSGRQSSSRSANSRSECGVSR